MNRSNSWLIAFFSALLSFPVLAQPDNSSVALLTQQLKTMDSLTAQFQQYIRDNRGKLLQEASGTLNVKRPRKFYWRTEQPYEHLLVTDGTTLWLYDIDLEQITKQPFTSDMDSAPALLLSGEIAQISEQYDVEILAQTATELSFKLTPLIADSLFKVLTIRFDDQRLAAMSFQDSFDQITDITFSDVQLNPDISEQLFIFTAPAGIDVISDES